MLRLLRYRVQTLLALTTVIAIAIVVVDWWSPDRIEFKSRLPILGPITSGSLIALDPPSDDEVLRALEKAISAETRVRRFLMDNQGRQVRIVKEKTADYVDPPRVYPLIGTAQQHHAHYRCTIYIGAKDRCDQYLLHVDHNHLHMVEPTVATNN